MRPPAVAGRFYPDDPADLRRMIEWCFSHPMGPGLPGDAGSSRKVRGMMAPHAGYMCSGMTAAHAYRRLREDGLPDVYVVIGPDHYGSAMGRTVLCGEDFLTPLGRCPVDRELVSRLSRSFPDVPAAHRMEHAIEVQVPFIQYIDPDPRIVPITMGDQSLHRVRELSRALTEALEGVDAVVVASTDMSHYIPRGRAAELDGRVLERVRAMDPEGVVGTVLRDRISMCGYGPTAVAMSVCAGCGAEVLRYSNSYDSLGMDPDGVVGYASAVFSEVR